MISRRRFVCGCSSLLALAGCGGGSGGGGDKPSATAEPNEPLDATPPAPAPALSEPVRTSSIDQSCVEPLGASAETAAAAGCGLVAGTGVPEIDARVAQELANQRIAFEWTGPFNWYDECGKAANAFSDPRDQSVLLSLGIFEKLAAHGWLAVDYVMAHEIAHQVQFRNMWNVKVNGSWREVELEADAFAFFYLWRNKIQIPNAEAEFIKAARGAWEIGDVNFGSTNHHGSHAQRAMMSLVAGEMAIAISERRMNTTWLDYHNYARARIAQIVADPQYLKNFSH